jgi:hypothetical protein
VRYRGVAELCLSEFSWLLNSVTFWYNDLDCGGGGVLCLDFGVYR